MGPHPVDAEGRMIPDAGWPPGKQAPGRLERVRRFLNTENPESGADHFGEPVRAAVWLAAEGWVTTVTEADVADLRRFRRTVRDLIGVQSGHPGVRAEWSDLPPPVLTVAVGTGEPVLIGAGDRVDRVCNDVWAMILEARASGSWARLRTCLNEQCRWAYYDHSRAANGTWCSMHACGQRHKMRAYRARRRAAGSRPGGHS